MKLEPFKFNLHNKIIPMAQSILITHGSHVPTIFTYDKRGIEKISDLSDLFSVQDKDVVYKVLGNFLNESDAVAFILITEAWMRKLSKDEYKDKEPKELLEGSKRVADYEDKEECLVFQWDFRLGNVKRDGSITYPFENSCGNICIDYANMVEKDDTSTEKSFSRASGLLAAAQVTEN